LDELEKVAEVLNSEPSQQCVIREEFLEDLSIDPEELAKVSGRSCRRAFEFIDLPEKNMTLRDKVFVFAAKEDT